jgi:Tol biopolymer transport system component
MTTKVCRSFFKLTVDASALFALAAGLWLISVSTSHAAFPGTNGKIAFVSNRDSNDEIYVMSANGSGQTNLTNSLADDTFPAWSPDGSKIAFVSARDGNEEIYVMNADGSNLTRLTNNSATDRYPAWSPDGKHIVFASLRDFPWKIYVMDAADVDADGNGDNLTKLTNNAASDYTPAWSPDGSTIAFGSDRTGFNQIFVMNSANGSNQTRLTNTSTQEQFPNWSPDGKRIAFASSRAGGYDIYTMEAVDADSDGNGDNLLRLTNTSATFPPSGNFDPTWSPDGNLIAFQSDRNSDWEIYVMNADGSNQINRSNNPATDGSPDWQPLPSSRALSAPAVGSLGLVLLGVVFLALAWTRLSDAGWFAR